AKFKNPIAGESFAAQHRVNRARFHLRPGAPAREPTGVNMHEFSNLTKVGFRAVCFGLAALAGAVAMSSAALAANVTTYHYDNLRTGWNSKERALTPNTVLNGLNGKTFKLTASVPLDDQVDAQPLLIRQQTIQGQGTHDVVYVVTANNTLYAIDAESGQILRQRNFGPPVPQSALPGACDNNGTNVGITSTPVIDRPAG